jgi:hypothetical protein
MRFEGPGSSFISLFLSLLLTLDSLLLSLLPFSDPVSSSEKSLLSDLLSETLCVSFSQPLLIIRKKYFSPHDCYRGYENNADKEIIFYVS